MGKALRRGEHEQRDEARFGLFFLICPEVNVGTDLIVIQMWTRPDSIDLRLIGGSGLCDFFFFFFLFNLTLTLNNILL